MSQDLANLRRYTRKTLYSLEENFSAVTDLAARGATDCIRVKVAIQKIQRDIKVDILKPMRDFKTSHFSSLERHIAALNYLVSLVEDVYLYSSHNEIIVFDGSTFIRGTGMNLSEIIDTMEKGKIEMLSMLNLLLTKFIPELKASYELFLLDVGYFRFHKVRFESLIRRLGGQECAWCLTAENTPLNTILRENIFDFYSLIDRHLREINHTIDSYFVQIQAYLLDMQEFTNATYHAIYSIHIVRLTNKVSESFNSTEIQLGNVIALLEAIEHLIWHHKCQGEAERVQDSFSNGHRHFMATLREIEGFVSDAEVNWHRNWNNYRDGLKNLSDVGRAYDFEGKYSIMYS